MAVLIAVGVFIGAIVGGIIVIVIAGLWLHIWVYLVGGKKGVEQTLKALMYGATPSYLFGWIPVVSVLAGIWALIVEIIGIRQLHELSTGKAVLAVSIGIIVPAIILGAIFAAFMATMPELVLLGTTGLGFGGF